MMIPLSQVPLFPDHLVYPLITGDPLWSLVTFPGSLVILKDHSVIFVLGGDHVPPSLDWLVKRLVVGMPRMPPAAAPAAFQVSP